jgi:hypothetical protein
MTIPLFALFIYNYRKAKKAGLITVRNSGRTTVQSIKHYAIEFDLAGVFLLAAGLALFLLPFSLYSYQTLGWKSPMIICKLVFGCVLLVAFTLFEQYIAPKTFIPYELLTDCTVLGACILSAVCSSSSTSGTAISHPSFKSSTISPLPKPPTWPTSTPSDHAFGP